MGRVDTLEPSHMAPGRGEWRWRLNKAAKLMVSKREPELKETFKTKIR